MKTVSLIIPIYNTEKYLRRCLESAINQTYPKIEIICIDDGSIDDSGRILDEYVNRDDRIVAVHQQNRGESAARNTGLKIASGDYIAFMDCDDWIEPQMYERMVTAMQEEKVDLVACGYFFSTDNSCVPAQNEKEVLEIVFDRTNLFHYVYERDAYKGFTSWIWCKLFKRELIDRNGELILFDETLRMGGDIVFFNKVASNVTRAFYIPIPYYHYYQRITSTAHSKDLKIIVDMMRAYQMMIDYMEDENIEKESIVWLKRFKVYWATLLGERAYKQRDDKNLSLAHQTMRQYQKEYIVTNKQYADRIKRYYEILNYCIEKSILS